MSEERKFQRWWGQYEDSGMSRPDALAAWEERARQSFGKAPSIYQPGERAYFQPVIAKIDARDQSSDESAIPVQIMAVKFGAGKVLYDIALPDGEGGFYTVLPLCGVDSFFLVKPSE